MKKKYFLSLFLFFHGYFCSAQQTPSENNPSNVEVVKMAYITRELNLTQEEAQNFWPVYNNYENEIKQARNQYPNDEVAFEKKVVEIKEFNRVIFTTCSEGASSNIKLRIIVWIYARIRR